jgi:hypothetical protein
VQFDVAWAVLVTVPAALTFASNVGSGWGLVVVSEQSE